MRSSMYNIKRKLTHPGEILNEDFLKPLGLSQSALAKEIGTTFRTINELVNKKRNMSTEMAIKLSKYFATSVDLWLNLQNQYDIHRIRVRKPELLEHIKPYAKTHKKVA